MWDNPRPWYRRSLGKFGHSSASDLHFISQGHPESIESIIVSALLSRVYITYEKLNNAQYCHGFSLTLSGMPDRRTLRGISTLKVSLLEDQPFSFRDPRVKD